MGLTLLAAQHLGLLCPQASCSRRDRVWIVTPWGSAEARKTHCGFKRTYSEFSACLLSCPHREGEAPNMHGLPHRCARPLIEAHESHRVAHPSMLPHASASRVYCACLLPSASNLAGLACSRSIRHNPTHSYPLPCVHASVHPQKSPKTFPTVIARSPPPPAPPSQAPATHSRRLPPGPLTCPGFQQQEQEHPGPDRSR